MRNGDAATLPLSPAPAIVSSAGAKHPKPPCQYLLWNGFSGKSEKKVLKNCLHVCQGKGIIPRELPGPRRRELSWVSLHWILFAMVHIFQSVELIRVMMITIKMAQKQVSIKSKGIFLLWVKSVSRYSWKPLQNPFPSKSWQHSARLFWDSDTFLHYYS